MKSAYELAMERLEKTQPTVALSEDQKKELAEVDSTCRAKIAERELFLRDEIRKAQTAGESSANCRAERGPKKGARGG